MRKIVALVLVSLALMLAGCSEPEIRFQNDEFDYSLLMKHRLAVGGIVLNSRLDSNQLNDPTVLEGPETLIQSDLWAHHLETSLLAQAPEMDRWSWASVSDQVDPELMDRVLQVYARGSILRQELLSPVAEDLPGSRFLLLARIDRNELSLHSQETETGLLESNPTGLGKPGGDADARPLDRSRYYQRRDVTLSLDLYDLENGRSLWSANVERNDNRLLNSLSGSEKPQVQVTRDPDAASGIQIEGRGGLTGGPTLDEILPYACDDLVAELLALARPADTSVPNE